MTLANWCLSNKTNGLISAQQISRHIQELQNHKLINVEISGGRRRAISCNGIDYTDPKPSFTPIVGLAETELTPSDTLILSMLANYSIFSGKPYDHQAIFRIYLIYRPYTQESHL